MEVEFLGAARTVTGSKHLLRTAHANVLLDCGLFQGRRQEALERNRAVDVDVRAIHAVVLSHAHTDHAGALPVLVKAGYEGPIYATPATRDLCAAQLLDAAMTQQADVRYINRIIERDGAAMETVEPLFSEADVVRALEQIIAVPYHRSVPIGAGVALTFFDAGHSLGSAISALDVDEGGKGRRLAFTGDLGRRHTPILGDPEVPPHVASVIMESTYGDRTHEPIDATISELAASVLRAFERGGKIIIPAFALDRAEELIYALTGLVRDKRVPPIPIYVYTPHVVSLADMLRLHVECCRESVRARIVSQSSPFESASLRYVSSAEESKAIDTASGPAIIIAASSMCEDGRVVHHLARTIEEPRNMVIMVGFQAMNTLGRRIVDRHPKVRVFGAERPVRAEVVVLDGFSAHADQPELLSWVTAVRAHGPLDQIALVHGEPAAQKAFRAQLQERGFAHVGIPMKGERMKL